MFIISSSSSSSSSINVNVIIIIVIINIMNRALSTRLIRSGFARYPAPAPPQPVDDHACLQDLRYDMCMYVYIYIYIYIHTYIHYIYIYIYIYIYRGQRHVGKYGRAHVCIRVRVYGRVYTCMGMYTCMGVCILVHPLPSLYDMCT